MSNTYKDRNSRKRKHKHRGCNSNGIKTCSWCANRLLIQTHRIESKIKDEIKCASYVESLHSIDGARL
jgi:hypothetical protein